MAFLKDCRFGQEGKEMKLSNEKREEILQNVLSAMFPEEKEALLQNKVGDVIRKEMEKDFLEGWEN